MNLSKNLKYLRKINNVSQQELANMVGVKKYKIAYIERRKDQSIEGLDKIADLFLTTDYDLCLGSVKKCKPILKDIPKEMKKDKQSMKSIAEFFKIIKNYQKLHDIEMHHLQQNFDPEINTKWK